MLDGADLSTLIVKIGDMGGGLIPFERCGSLVLLTVMIALWRANDESLPVTPMALRAPGLIQPRSWDQKVEIWAIGCLVKLLYLSCGL